MRKKPPPRKAGAASAKLDKIDEVQAAWRREAPSLDTSPIGILGRVYRIASLASGPIGNVLERHGLERGAFDVLATLYRVGAPHELTPTDLYRQLMVSSGGMTYRLKSLEDAGLIARAKSQADGRSSKVRLTDLGRERVVAAYRDDLKVEARLLNGLEAGDRAKLVAALRELHLIVLRNIEALD